MRSKEEQKTYKHQWYLEHKADQIARVMRWRQANRDKHEKSTLLSNQRYKEEYNKRKNERQTKIKIDVLTHYGNGECKCVRCGFDDIRALSIDHINGNGTKERRRTGRGGKRFYRWLKNQGYLEGYQTLCMNCQFIKATKEAEYKWMPKTNKPHTAAPGN